MIWGSNLGSSIRTIYTQKYSDQLQHPPTLQIQLFSGRQSDNSIRLEPSLKISGAIPPLNLSLSMANSGTTLFNLNLLAMYKSLKRSHPFWTYKRTFLYSSYCLHAHCMTHLFHLYSFEYMKVMKRLTNLVKQFSVSFCY